MLGNMRGVKCGGSTLLEGNSRLEEVVVAIKDGQGVVAVDEGGEATDSATEVGVTRGNI